MPSLTTVTLSKEIAFTAKKTLHTNSSSFSPPSFLDITPALQRYLRNSCCSTYSPLYSTSLNPHPTSVFLIKQSYPFSQPKYNNKHGEAFITITFLLQALRQLHTKRKTSRIIHTQFLQSQVARGLGKLIPPSRASIPVPYPHSSTNDPIIIKKSNALVTVKLVILRVADVETNAEKERFSALA